MRRRVRPGPGRTIVTIQSGAFPSRGDGTEGGQASEIIAAAPTLPKRGRISFIGYEDPPSRDVDLSKADIIVTAGRGVGKKENIALVEELAKALGGQVGASRPVIDAGWLPQSRQVGSTGQNVSPKLYVACGVSGAIQHLAGMRRSAFIVAINKDREAPIAEIADVLVVTDVLRFAPLLSTRLRATLGSSAAASPSST
jgi:electron transfer flavoprotein alpha subunit